MTKPEGTDAPLHEIAGGWITERTGTKIPVFLKIAYVGFSLFGLSYLFLYVSGETSHTTRGVLVQEFNRAGEALSTFWLAVIAGLLAAFICTLMVLAFGRDDEGAEE